MLLAAAAAASLHVSPLPHAGKTKGESKRFTLHTKGIFSYTSTHFAVSNVLIVAIFVFSIIAVSFLPF